MLPDTDWTPVDRFQRLRLVKLEVQDRLSLNRLVRWQRQSVARSILPDERVAKCYRVRVQEFVDVFRSQKFERAHYGGLFTCSSVWVCPVCAAKITERRRLELQAAVDKATEKRISFFMVTWTLQHTKDDSLLGVRDALAVALRKLKAGRWYQGFISSYGIIGNVTGSEVTYGSEFGWHYHRHSIFFTTRALSEFDLKVIQLDLSAKYRALLEKMGRYAHPIVGVDVRTGDSLIADYVAKYGQQRDISSWSLAAEVTKGFSKGALQANDHFTPFELLDLALHLEDGAADLFREYSDVMKGNHQIRWSPGLREVLGLDVEIMTDEEIASVQDDDAVLFAQVTARQWRNILRKELRGQLLDVASLGNIEAFQIWLSSLE